jgi:hypothetical protein
VALLGLATLAVGAWLIATQGTKNTACNASLGKQSGMGPVCSHIVFSYFGGFGLVGAGVILLGVSAILMKRKNMRSRRGKILLEGERRHSTQVYPAQPTWLTGGRDRSSKNTPINLESPEDEQQTNPRRRSRRSPR